MWDWPEVTVQAFGKTYRAKIKGKVRAVDNGNIHLWAQEAGIDQRMVRAGTWSEFRCLPAEFLIGGSADENAPTRPSGGSQTAQEAVTREERPLSGGPRCAKCDKPLVRRRFDAKTCGSRCRTALARVEAQGSEVV
jgi:hypothetical protein